MRKAGKELVDVHGACSEKNGAGPNDRALTPDDSVVALPSQLLHTMLLIIEHSRGKGEFAGYSYVSERDDNHALGILGLDVADDAAHIAEVRDF